MLKLFRLPNKPYFNFLSNRLTVVRPIRYFLFVSTFAKKVNVCRTHFFSLIGSPATASSISSFRAISISGVFFRQPCAHLLAGVFGSLVALPSCCPTRAFRDESYLCSCRLSAPSSSSRHAPVSLPLSLHTSGAVARRAGSETNSSDGGILCPDVIRVVNSFHIGIDILLFLSFFHLPRLKLMGDGIMQNVKLITNGS